VRRWAVALSLPILLTAALAASAAAQQGPLPCAGSALYLEGEDFLARVPPEECAVARLPGPRLAPGEGPPEATAVYALWDARPMTDPYYRFAPGDSPEGLLYCTSVCGDEGSGWMRGGDLGRLLHRYGTLAREGLVTRQTEWRAAALASIARWGGWLEVTDASGRPIARWQGEEGQRLSAALANAGRVVVGLRGPGTEALMEGATAPVWGSGDPWPWPLFFLRLRYGDVDATTFVLAPTGALTDAPLPLLRRARLEGDAAGAPAIVLLEGMQVEGELAERLRAALPTATRPPRWETDVVAGDMSEVRHVEPLLRSVVLRKGGEERLVLLRDPLPASAVFAAGAPSDAEQLRRIYAAGDEWHLELEWAIPHVPFGDHRFLAPGPLPSRGIYYARGRLLVLLEGDAQGRERAYLGLGDLRRVVESVTEEMSAQATASGRLRQQQTPAPDAAAGTESGPVALVLGGAAIGAAALTLVYLLARRRQRTPDEAPGP